ncbi:MAG: tetratricopeptide repeat protein, partial [Magnetococcales bacterium]|nr:tetratricopeptide repeat protein [Magnetococcales bacterium]
GIDALLTAIQKVPEHTPYYMAISRLYARANRHKEAVALLEKAVEQMPDNLELIQKLADFDMLFDRLARCEVLHRRVLSMNPQQADSWHRLAQVVRDQGRAHEAVTCYEKAIALQPDNPMWSGDLIFCSDMTPGIGVEQQQQRRKAWVAKFLPIPSATPFENDRDPERRLRVGYVSADFYHHSAAATFATPLLDYDRAQFEVFLYCNTDPKNRDTATELFRNRATAWREINGLDDDRLEAMIRKDRIDILVDLSGLSNGNRMPVFARRPAPIQYTGWGYNLGTGLKTINALVIDDVMLPPREHHHFAEGIVSLTAGIHYRGLKPYPDVAPPPCLQNGFITFGSFNRAEKINLEVVAAWAAVLKAVPDARLVVNPVRNRPEAFIERFGAQMGAHGIHLDRLTVIAKCQTAEHFNHFNRVDMVLDPFPHNGGVSSLEALRMGVPIIALRGETITGRLSASFLTTLGMTDWLAEDVAEYVEIARSKAADPQALFELRTGLRARFDASPLGDAAFYMRELQGVFRQAWRDWVNHDSPIIP